jgi:hypothetical protein
MSMVNQTPQRGSGPKARIVIAATVAALLLGSSFYAAQAGNNSGYDSDLSGLETAAIVVGGIGAGAIVMGALAKDDDEEDASTDKAKSAKAVEHLRIVPSQTRVGAGDSATVEVQAQYQGSKTWQNVTNLANVQLVSGDLTVVDGSKNAFAVPYGSKVASGNATIAASFGGQSASTRVAVN